MKKLINSILATFSSGLAKFSLSEASMNFDLEGGKPFLTRLGFLVEEGLSGEVIDELYDFTANLKHDEEEEMSLTVKYKGEEVWIIYKVLMGDIDSPDLYFFTTKEFSDAISLEMDKYAEEFGI